MESKEEDDEELKILVRSLVELRGQWRGLFGFGAMLSRPSSVIILSQVFIIIL